MIIKGKQNIIKAGTYKMVTAVENEESNIQEALQNIIIPAQSNVDSLLGKMAEDADGALLEAKE